jgi:hypothetical protein
MRLRKGGDMDRRTGWWIQLGFLCALLLLGATLHEADAQATTTCAPQSLLTIARAGAACNALEAGNACYGSGTVATSTEQAAAAGLRQLGDRVALRDLTSVTTSPPVDDAAAVSIAAVSIRTSPRASDVVILLLLQAVALRSEVTPVNEVVMQATGALNVRALPANDGEVIASLGVNSSVLATGRSDNWLRVTIPTTGASGWAAASLLAAVNGGNTQSLPQVQPGDVLLQPFERFSLTMGDATACEGQLRAGVLMQTPSTDAEDAVGVTMNGGLLRLAGTLFVTRQNDTLIVIALDGHAEIGEGAAAQLVPAGAQYVLPPVAGANAAAPYDAALTTALPLNNLPRRFQGVLPRSQAEIDAWIAEFRLPPPTAIPVDPTAENACRRSVGQDTEVWSGPGQDFEILATLAAGRQIQPVLAATDPQGNTWWQLENSGWVARDVVVERGDCSNQIVPVTDRVAAPRTNTYSLERCESFNGPVRAGQRVTFEFTPPAWDNLGEATAATRTDPGRFTFNAEVRRATVSQPFRLGAVTDPLEDRYLRRFTYVWTAQPGTYRITGDWLSYEPSCNLTVAAESASR